MADCRPFGPWRGSAGRRVAPTPEGASSVARHLDTVEAGASAPRPARCTRILAESAESRPSRYAVAWRAWTQQPPPRDGNCEKDGEGEETRTPRDGPANGFANETPRNRGDAARGARQLRSSCPGQRDAAASQGPARRASWYS
jgi:hypothetical protein